MTLKIRLMRWYYICIFDMCTVYAPIKRKLFFMMYIIALV